MAEQVTPGSTWQHRNGIQYNVHWVANTAATNLDHPPIVVYYNSRNGEEYVRFLSDWHRSMSKVYAVDITFLGEGGVEEGPWPLFGTRAEILAHCNSLEEQGAHSIAVTGDEEYDEDYPNG